MTVLRSVVIILVGASFSQHVLAFCSAPSMYTLVPEPPSSFSRPTPPFCLSGYQFSGSHTCSEWEINSYIDEINDYISTLSRFVEEAEDFAIEAQDFSSAAIQYAKCEASDVKSTIE